MNRERSKVLDMVAKGSVSTEDAERLLGRLDAPGKMPVLVDAPPTPGSIGTKPLKFLRIVIEGKNQANIRVPIALIRTGIKFSALIPLQASEHLAEQGIDLSEFAGLSGDELTEALRELKVDVVTQDGHEIYVFCE